jgi:hypothetical protein
MQSINAPLPIRLGHKIGQHVADAVESGLHALDFHQQVPDEFRRIRPGKSIVIGRFSLLARGRTADLIGILILILPDIVHLVL